MSRHHQTCSFGGAFLIVLFLCAAIPSVPIGAAAPQRGSGGARPTARWLGQDGKDLVGPRSEPGPSDVQDLHIRLAGLPPGREVAKLIVRGQGGDEWQYQGPFGPWRAELVREKGASQADLFLEPTRVEKGRGFTITLTYDDGTSAEIILDGGRADPNLRMPQARLGAKWLGQDGLDRAGLGPGVGPDGLVDAAIALERLSQGVELRSLTIRAKDGTVWETGVNPKGHHAAWFVREPNDPTRGTVFFQPDRERGKEMLEIRAVYGNDKSDSVSVSAGPLKPALAVSRAKVPNLAPLRPRATWDSPATEASTRGYVVLRLSGLPPKPVTAAALSDAAGEVWVYRANGSDGFDAASYPRPLEWRAGTGPGQATLLFPPVRDESDDRLDLRVRFGDGAEALASIAGGPADVSLRSAAPVGPERIAQPGEDLARLVETSGTLRLAAGTHVLKRPLVLARAIAITAGPNTTLQFEQPSDSPPWTAAIKIHAGRTTLEGFRVRFAGPVRWDREVSYGPAVIGTTDNRDTSQPDARAGLVFRHLDIEAPPPSTEWEEAPRSLRLVSAAGGEITGNTLRGGCIELSGGPWRVEDNTHLGTHPGSFAFSVLSAHHTHDLLVRGNTTRAEGSSGKTWRFLVLTAGGWRDEIRDNRINDVGPRDSDDRTENAPEIILTEAYRLRFEGAPLGLSADRRVLVIPDPQGDAGEPGDVVAILAGPHAGSFRRVAQRINRTTYLLDAPLPPLAEVPQVSLGVHGFARTRFEGNVIDGRGSRQAAGFVLAGHHYGTRVIGNTVRGCGEGIRIVACPTEQPGPWGWSHAPMFGIDVSGNRLEGPARGLTVAVEHGPPIASNKGRLYYSGWLRDNVIAPGTGTGSALSPAFVIGDARALDPNELVVSVGGNTLEGGPAGRSAVRIEAGKTYPISDDRPTGR
jgi:hypothetical protein